MLPYIAYMDPMGHGISSLGDRGFVQHERWVLGGSSGTWFCLRVIC